MDIGDGIKMVKRWLLHVSAGLAGAARTSTASLVLLQYVAEAGRMAMAGSD